MIDSVDKRIMSKYKSMLLSESVAQTQNVETRLYHINKHNEEKVKEFPVEYREVSLKTHIDIPDGVYDGIQGGYMIELPSIDKKLETTVGVRGHDIPIRVKITNGKVEEMYYRATEQEMFKINGMSAR